MERLVTTSQAAEILGLSLQGVHYRIRKNQLKSIKQAGKTFVYINDYDAKNSNQNLKVEPVQQQTQNQQNSYDSIIEVKNEQIDLLKKSMKWMKKQYISEIVRLEKNQKRIIDVFNSEIKLLQSAFNEMRSIYKPQLQNNIKENEESFIKLKEFFIFMKKNGKSDKEIKYLIFKAIKNGDSRFIYNKNEKKLLILNTNFEDLL